jgi:topoisomerase-like DNA binding C4 zinc finger protein
MTFTEIVDTVNGLQDQLTEAFNSILAKPIKPLPSLPPKKLPLYRNPNECPQCHQGRVRKVRTRGGAYFYGCSRYPQCRYMSRA